jgi:hypothetical protein
MECCNYIRIHPLPSSLSLSLSLFLFNMFTTNLKLPKEQPKRKSKEQPLGTEGCKKRKRSIEKAWTTTEMIEQVNAQRAFVRGKKCCVTTGFLCSEGYKRGDVCGSCGFFDVASCSEVCGEGECE